MTTFPAFRILHPTILNIIRPQPGKLRDARTFEWIDAVVWGMGGAFFGLFRVQTYSLTSQRAHVNFLVISPRDFPDASGPGYQRVPPLVPGQNFKTSITFAMGVRFRPTNYQNEAIDDDYISNISEFASNNMKNLSGHNRVNCSTRARLNGWMQS